MTDPKHIPYLIDLLDDDAPSASPEVLRELLAFGPTLKPQLEQLGVALNPKQRQVLQNIYDELNRRQLRQMWPLWMRIADDYQKLEKALALLAKFLSGDNDSRPLSDLLDTLAKQYEKQYAYNDPRLLAEFLFQKKGLRGNESDYYNPQNSNLHFVIAKHKGIPLSLTSVYMLVGKRLGLSIEGCLFPGHFLGRVRIAGEMIFVDCFNQGRIIDKEDLLNVRPDHVASLESILSEKTTSELIVRRYLANLICAYQVNEHIDGQSATIQLFKELDQMVLGRAVIPFYADGKPVTVKPSFRLGEIVRHAQYGYRGIIVDVNDSCRANDDWYYSNQTQPDRNQPWYHVLVDGSDQVTYVAQANLTSAQSAEKIAHPLLNHFFIKSKDGRYIRNENPWPTK